MPNGMSLGYYYKPCELDCVMGFCAQVILLSLCSSAFTKLHAQVMLALLAAIDRQRG